MAETTSSQESDTPEVPSAFDFDKAVDSIRAAAKVLADDQVKNSLCTLQDAANAAEGVQKTIATALPDVGKAVAIQDAVKAVAVQDAVKGVAIQDAVRAVGISAAQQDSMQRLVEHSLKEVRQAIRAMVDEEIARAVEAIREAARRPSKEG